MEDSYERKTIVCFHRLDVMKIVDILKDQGWEVDGSIKSTSYSYKQNLRRKKK